MTRVLLTPAARADLDAIWDYTVTQWGVTQAERYVGGIRDVCAALAAGVFHDRDAGHVRPGLRKAPVGSHVLFFRRRDDGAVEVLRILHRRMDVDRQLG